MNLHHSLPSYLARFVHEDESSCFTDEVQQEQQGDIRQRLEDLRRHQDEVNDARFEAWRTRGNIKNALTRSGDFATHDGSDEPAGLEVPGVIAVTPDGSVYESKERKKMSLLQSMSRDAVAMRNNAMSGRNGLDMFSLFRTPYTNTHSNKPKKCETCLNLRDTYGKTTLNDIRQSRRSCWTCNMVLEALGIYSGVLDDEDRVRIFAPIASGNTLRIWCHDKLSTIGEIPFMIELYVLPGQPTPSPSISASSEISGDTSSSEAFAQARYWLNECTQNHDRCPSTGVAPLPRRLLHFNHDGERWHVRLSETQGSYGRYACLSHRWGKQGASELLKTTRANYKDHLSQISFQSLPRTFQHAIVSSRRLGIQYLWIDSVCIIQDDNADWKAEAANMGSYYGKAYITLAASWSPGPKGGCFSYAEPEYIGRQLYRQQGCTIHARRIIAHGYRWPLLGRGWIYQERLLSPRVLHFGPLELVWECYTCTTCECGQSNNLHTDLSNKIEHWKIMGHATRKETFRNRWRNMIQEYSRLDLTFARDRFPALAGLAKEMQYYRQSEYYAGLWVDSFIGDLLWGADYGIFQQAEPRESDNKAPTWSWASVNARINYGNVGTKATESGAERCYERIQTTFVKLVSIDGEPLAEENSGASEDCQILLRGPCIDGTIQHVPLHNRLDPPPDPNTCDNPQYYEMERDYYEKRKNKLKSLLRLNGVEPPKFDSGNEFSPDYGLFHEGRYHMGSGASVLIMKMASVKADDSIYSDDRILCLVLRQLSPFPRTYERIGLVKWRLGDDPLKAFDKAEDMVLRLI
ncbi:HET-domain-containing protein [Decorospora gaudefroyi]|uniref:HET-domain-containing protein n=1 Tax=Decorospora gaudefroyi TaxID=184978 RepID=A0A6A5KIX0_9PLEO|nr:HET-domain-containing protein [Decorospora gaudefroyi]